MLAIVLLEQHHDPSELGPDVEQRLDDSRDVVVRDHRESMGSGEAGDKMALWGMSPGAPATTATAPASAARETAARAGGGGS